MNPGFPFINNRWSFILLRWSVALIFFLHAIVRIINNTIPEFAGFLETKGILFATTIVWAITLFEIAGSIALALNYNARCLSILFILMLITGIILIHAKPGWFVGEHGTGGVEYSFILIVCLLHIAAGQNKKSVSQNAF